MTELEGRVVLVTGAARGLGAAVLRTLCRHGATVVGCDVRGELLQRTVDDAVAAGGRAEAVTMDVTRDDEVARAVDAIAERHGRLDVLVNNAAVDHTLPVEDLSVLQFDQVIGTNLRGAFLTCRSAVPHLKRSRGSIVNVSSTAAVAVWPCASAYHASKWGLRGFTHALNQELRASGVRVTAIVSGGMKTPFILERFPDVDPDTLQDPQLVADAIVFALRQPPSTHVPELVIMPMRDPSYP